MSSKEKPTLGGTRIKTRKRNIAVPLDPSGFADNVVNVCLKYQGDLDLISKEIEVDDELDFSRYGDTLFEVFFTGGRTAAGSTVVVEDSSRQPYAVLNCEPTKESILPYILFIQKIIRRRPFLIKNLENVLRRLLQSLEHYGAEDRKKLAIFTALTFSQKLSGLPPENIFTCLFNDAMVSKGSVLGFVTNVFKVFLEESTLDELVALLKRAKVEDRMLEFFPMQKRTPEYFAEHFMKEGLSEIVEYNRKKVFDVMLKELHTSLSELMSEGGPANLGDAIELVKQRRKEGELPDVDIVKTIWEAMMDAVQWSGKNQQQNINNALRQVKGWAKLLGAFCTNPRLEIELMYKIQIHCYEDAKLMKLFHEIVRALYDLDVLSEDVILKWVRKGNLTKGRQMFVKSLEPFVKWLEEAEEESEDEN
eukprot:TRINITY_DN251_c0_g1_i2.p1 TRINITY_DN251_c0_g1~~TRINITY_DN251_c0_g1_i2.p1  ORF type:complete len:420 (+),score=113.72 TRINITY_DN251_c0_g1_i2:563-1822(+)